MSKIDSIIKRLRQILHTIPGCGIFKDGNSIKWGIIGTGYMAKTFTAAIQESRKDIPYAVLSRTENRATAFARRFGIKKTFTEISQFLKCDDIDVVYIATPVECHYRDIKDCLNAGKNILCEKPITTDIDQLKEIIELAENKKCFIMEGMWMKFLPTFRTAERWIKEGCIGEIKGIRADLYKRVETSDMSPLKSVMEDYGEYPISFITHFLPDADIENSSCIKNDNGTDTDWNIILKDKNAYGIINISSRFGSLSKAVIIGSKGSVEWESQFNRTSKVCLYDNNGVVKDTAVYKYRNEGFEYELNAVNECVSNGSTESDIATLNSTLHSIEIIDRLIRNCRDGK